MDLNPAAMQELFVKGEYDECLNQIDQAFGKFRNYYTTDFSKRVHQCNRKKDCECVVYGSYLLAIAHHQNIQDIKQFLESVFYFQPETRVPFELFTKWLQLEITRKNYTFAANLLKGYISSSQKYMDEGESQGEQSAQNYFGDQYFMGPYSYGSVNELRLSREQYNELMELLVFFIYLPDKGMIRTKDTLQEIPLQKELRIQFLERLKEMKNAVVTEVAMANDQELKVKGDPSKQKDDLTGTNQAEEFKKNDEQGQPLPLWKYYLLEVYKMPNDHKLWYILTSIALYLLAKLIFLRVRLHRLLLRGFLKASITKFFMRVLFNYKL